MGFAAVSALSSAGEPGSIASMSLTKGYFGVGALGVNKPRNVGALFRTANAFCASFVFAIGPTYHEKPGAMAEEDALAQSVGLERRGRRAVDTSNTDDSLPYHVFPDIDAWAPPQGCSLVGIELTADAIDLPSFRHPRRAAYLLGPERGDLPPPVLDRCDHVVRIPAKFCVNLSVAGAVVIYDRMVSLGRFAERPVRVGGPTDPPPEHVHGRPIFRRGDPFKTAETG